MHTQSAASVFVQNLLKFIFRENPFDRSKIFWKSLKAEEDGYIYE